MARLRLSVGAMVMGARTAMSSTAMERARSPCREIAWTMSRSDTRPAIASPFFTTSAAILRSRMRSAAFLTVAVASIVTISVRLRSMIV